MKTIHKYKLQLSQKQDVVMPFNAKIISVMMQGDTLCLWAIVDAETAVNENVTIRIYGTGNQIDDNLSLDHIGSVINDDFVWHVFQEC